MDTDSADSAWPSGLRRRTQRASGSASVNDATISLPVSPSGHHLTILWSPFDQLRPWSSPGAGQHLWGGHHMSAELKRIKGSKGGAWSRGRAAPHPCKNSLKLQFCINMSTPVHLMSRLLPTPVGTRRYWCTDSRPSCLCLSDWSRGCLDRLLDLFTLIGFYALVLFLPVLVIHTCRWLSWPALWITFGRTIKCWFIDWLIEDLWLVRRDGQCVCLVFSGFFVCRTVT